MPPTTLVLVDAQLLTAVGAHELAVLAWERLIDGAALGTVVHRRTALTTHPRQRTIGNRMDTESLRAEIKRARAERDRLTEYIGALEIALAIKSGEQLPPTGRHRSVSGMQVNTEGMSTRVRRAASNATRDHKGLRMLYEHDVSQSQLARELKETRPRVSAWFATGEGNRPIPRRHVTYLTKRYGIPEDVWERIAD